MKRSKTLPTDQLPVFRRERLVDDVTRLLREMIIDGRLPPGKQLLQVELSEQLGISRTPLREALRVLENDGLVRSSPTNRTVEVVTITREELADMLEVREVIDGLCARLLAQIGLSPQLASDLSATLAEMKASSKPYDPARRTTAHARFHALIAEHCQNVSVQSFIPMIRASSAALYTPVINDPSAVQMVNDGRLMAYQELLDGAHDAHEAIFEALLEKNAKKAETLARRHIAQTRRFVPRLDELERLIDDSKAERAS
jgi:GntR family transcriptional regulator of vanillate catabolism